YDANHDGGTPFTGPALWDSNLDVYAMPSGGNGSHIDMLHASPYSMGIAHEIDNVFWVFDANSNDIVRYDFADDHGPGNTFHGDAIVRRYPEVVVDWVNQDIPSHMILDKETNWLYVVDGSTATVKRVDITSGTIGGTPSFSATEALAEYRNVTGITQEVAIDGGLDMPVGIEVIGDRLLVSDMGTSEIVVYDLNSSIPFAELGRIPTDATEIMGIKVGPEGNIWYVDAAANEVVKLSPISTGIDDLTSPQVSISVVPNPASGAGQVNFIAPVSGMVNIEIYNSVGALVTAKSVRANAGTPQSEQFELATGIYTVQVALDGVRSTAKWVIVE
ncbi:MAG: hypothetical protein ACI959_000534, partial [Limisphaerales bacterium]